MDALNYSYTRQSLTAVMDKVEKDRVQHEPFQGIGKPVLSKHHLSGYWSRRIDGEHRLVCAIENNCLKIVQCRYHYI
ncbi:MAG: Txe/YoeB family addiction module toxin [Pseudomonadota bacterium]